MKKYLCTFFVVALFCALPLMSACATQNFPADQVTIETKSGQVFIFDVELAEYPAQQKQGLMGRTHLDETAGMLFLFGEEGDQVFWMKDTLIPLDLLFIARDGTIHHIHHMAKPLDETSITSQRPAAAVLEINGGLSDKLGIAEGDRVVHKAFPNTLAQ